ncbi:MULTISPECIES: penicillin-binding protein 1A [Dethiosulfovibrio]|uniref:peptidoglycan glycosyltransferase n=2 Tax=Dethiosulfovibrio TaxID=47054 RepID=A0ABS9EQA8_9BACT|nr:MULTISPECIES: PBP1A family penicillin-binding protein [Dethiosulfovibrio]MCF4115062.1 PBP1A family penicillin-binding protein [Dethiosulfovibrio russensis]MCF4143384.1 PBP1A family penicillin-binding protein [Dethiosulfovibrio marinus]MCF4145497.1 PBP1A family penicillin-binding protein [Dethiosulfovibrio acidaminovorans]
MLRKKTKNRKAPSSLWRILGTFFFLSLTVIVALSAIGTAVIVSKLAQDLPSDDEILSYKANEASVVYDRNGKVITKLFLENRRPVELKDISRWMVMSTLAAEDSSFYSHHGIRPLAIMRSIFSGEGGHGASTITQQLARNLFLTLDQTMQRKGREAILSLRIEQLYSKDKILETYLNAIYFGHGAWGIGAAAQAYFGKTPSSLTLAEASVLAGLIAAPERYSPIKNLKKAKVRQRYVLQRLTTLGWITEEQKKRAQSEKLTFNNTTVKNVLNVNKAPYFVSHILFKRLLPKYGRDRVYSSGLKIYTTIDLDLQIAAEEAIQELKSEGAIVAMDPETGEILALVGGKDFEVSKFNRATQAYRQPGSAFKPILYTAALESGYMPTDHILDKPISYEIKESVDKIWTPGNYSKKFAGEETLFEALTHSHNTPAVRLTDLTGVEAVMSMARRLGITSPHLSPALSIGLGTASVTPLEMASVYCVYANNGKKVAPYSIREIRDNNDKTLESHAPRLEDAIDSSTAIVMRSMLIDVVKAGTGRRAALTGYEVFGKTGTTNEYSDAWFAGGLPGLVSVVYAGNDDHKPLGRAATGGRVALPVWKNFMEKAVTMRTYPSIFDVPEDSAVIKVRVCRKSGYIASDGCSFAELYLPQDRAPKAICPLHGGSPMMAMEDPNAPRLLLLPQDRSFQLGEMTVPSEVAPSVIPPSIPAHVPPGIAPATDPYADERETPATVEDKYQQLLKQYGLSD